MELRTKGGRLELGGAFKLVAAGYFLGGLAIFLPLFLLIAVASIAAGLAPAYNGAQASANSGIMFAVFPLIMFPIILAMQAVMLGGLAVLGLWLYQKRRPIRVVED